MQKFYAIKKLSAAKSRKRSNASPFRVLQPIASAFRKKKINGNKIKCGIR